jgi:hypothetical protein
MNVAYDYTEYIIFVLLINLINNKLNQQQSNMTFTPQTLKHGNGKLSVELAYSKLKCVVPQLLLL